MSLLLGIIYLPWTSGRASWSGMAGYVSGIPGSGILRGNDIHDHCVWNDHFQSAE